MKFLLITFIFLTFITSYATPARPRIVVRDTKGNTLSLENGIGARSLGVMRFEIESDNQTVFKVKAMNCLLIRGRTQVEAVSINSNEADFTPWAAKALPGDRIMVTITRVIKVEDKQEIEAVETKGTLFNIPIN